MYRGIIQKSYPNVFSLPIENFSRAKTAKRTPVMFRVFLYNFQNLPVGEYCTLSAAKRAGNDTGFEYIIYYNETAYYSGGPFHGYYV